LSDNPVIAGARRGIPEPMMDKTLDAFRTIGEVAEELDLPQHVLRFWETKFNQIRPVKRVGGRRYYRPEDVQLVAAIRVLLYGEGYTIRGVQRILKEQGVRALIAASRAGGRAASTDEASKAAPVAEIAAAPETVPPEPEEEKAESVAPANGGLEAHLVPGLGTTRLSAQDRHRMEAILVELAEGGRLLDEARRR
jgi:DNA-binding transcriptional MerR regulator